MLILGLVLLLAAVALTAGMLLGNTKNAPVEVFGYTTDAFSVGELFALGIATGVIAGLSLALVMSGMRRSGRKRRERRAELKAKRARERELQEENARLARELDQQRQAGATGPGATTAPGRPDASGGPGGPGPGPGGPGPGGPGPGGPGPGGPEGPGGADRTQPMTKWSAGADRPPQHSSDGSTGFERPGGPGSQAPASSSDSPQEGRRPLS